MYLRLKLTCNKFLNLKRSNVQEICSNLAKLYHFDELSNAELKDIISKYYDLYLDEETTDMERIASKVFETTKYSWSWLETDIIEKSGQQCYYLKVGCYYKDSEKPDLTHVYSAKEIKELIACKIIVITTSDYSSRTVSDNVVDDLKPSIISLNEVDESDLGDYEDIILEWIRKRMTKARVAKDISRVTNTVRSYLTKQQYLLTKYEESLSADAPQITRKRTK